MGVLVRERRAADSRGMRLVARRAWRATYAGIAPDGLVKAVLRRGYDRRRLVETLADPQRDAFVAEDSGRVLGYADCLEDPPGRVELLRIYVLPAEQGRGIGRALLAACAEAAARRTVASIEVLVDRKNRRALLWYARQGFARTGTGAFVVGRWRRPQVRMSLPLASPLTPR